jgi:hypothetical protein
VSYFPAVETFPFFLKSGSFFSCQCVGFDNIDFHTIFSFGYGPSSLVAPRFPEDGSPLLCFRWRDF